MEETWREGLGSLLIGFAVIFGAFSSKIFRWVDLPSRRASQAQEGRIFGVKLWPNLSWIILGFLSRGWD